MRMLGFYTLARSFEPAPSARAVAGDDLLEHPLQRHGAERLAFMDGDRPGRLIVMAAGDEPSGSGTIAPS